MRQLGGTEPVADTDGVRGRVQHEMPRGASCNRKVAVPCLLVWRMWWLRPTT